MKDKFSFATLVISFLALIVSIISSINSHKTTKEQITQNERLTYLENDFQKERDRKEYLKNIYDELQDLIVTIEAKIPVQYSNVNYASAYFENSYESDLKSFSTLVESFCSRVDQKKDFLTEDIIYSSTSLRVCSLDLLIRYNLVKLEHEGLIKESTQNEYEKSYLSLLTEIKDLVNNINGQIDVSLFSLFYKG